MDPRQASIRAGGDGAPGPERADAGSDAVRQAPSRLIRWRPHALAALAGLLSILSFPGAGLWPLAFFSIVPLLIALEGATPRRAVLLGWIAGFTGNAFGFYWLVNTVREFGDLPLPIAVLSYLLLAAGNGLSWGVFAALYRWVGGSAPAPPVLAHGAAGVGKPGEPRWWWAALGWGAMEFGWWSVFPYYFGAGLYKVPLLMQGADVTSILG
jgi:apolipoprotein N-acyltransferase